MPGRQRTANPRRGVVKQHPAAVHQQHPVGNRKDLLQPVLHQQDRQPQFAVQLLQRCNEIGSGNRVKLAGRLVQNQHLRLHDHDRRKVENLLLPARECVGLLSEPALNAEIACHLANAAANDLGRQPQIFQTECQLVPNLVGHNLVVRVLEDVPDFRWGPLPSGVGDAAGQFPRRCQLGLEQPEQRGLAAAGFAAHHHKFPAPHRKADMLHSRLPGAGVAKAQILDL